MATGHLTAGLAALIAVAGLATAVPAAAVPLWELQGESGNRVFLLGSVHFLRPGDYPLPRAVDAAIAAADVVYLELDLDDPTAADPAVMLALAVDPVGRELPDLLGATAFASAERAARALRLDLEPLRRFEPWYAALVLTQQRLTQLGFAGEQGVEGYVVAAARDDDKDIRGLETLRQQLASLDGLPLPVQRRFLASTLEEAASIGDEVDDIVAAWRRGDTAELEERLLGDLAAEPEVYRRVVVDRNERFLRQVQKLLRGRDDCLVVVGTLHLVGADGLIERLADEGYAARALR